MTKRIVRDDGAVCCSECFSPSQDVTRGHIQMAVPEGCVDEDCDCHLPPLPKLERIPTDGLARSFEAIERMQRRLV